ncbi:unnamed protein product [Leptosia nina]|uniref:Uncharacterized protein n=1 Tax=Leptosia nina TaxID=320188 RepID=A0AAV1K5F8_9NEOP
MIRLVDGGSRVQRVPGRAVRCAPPLHLTAETAKQVATSPLTYRRVPNRPRQTVSARVLSPPVVVSEVRARTRPHCEHGVCTAVVKCRRCVYRKKKKQLCPVKGEQRPPVSSTSDPDESGAKVERRIASRVVIVSNKATRPGADVGRPPPHLPALKGS